MSYNILLDLSDAPDIYDTNSGTNDTNKAFKNCNILGHQFTNLIAFVGRALYFRRLKLLKLYMATFVFFFILFILLSTSSSSNDQTVKSASKPILSQSHADNNDLHANKESVHAQETTQPGGWGTEKDSILVGRPTYPNNLTYLLSMKDFVEMKRLNVMQVRVREAMKHSWDNYRRYAWGYDMLKPRSKEADHWFHLGLTIVDSADTLIMMGMVNDANLALDWIENDLKLYTPSENSNCFELTIRILGGILAAYHLTAREKLKQQATSMGDVLLHCYDTESKIIPFSDIDLTSHRAHPPPWNPHSSLSEVASLQLEFRYLSQISMKQIYEQTTFQTSLHIHNLTTNRERKLLPMYISPTTGQLEDSIITLGARTDSYYEYLLKQYLQTGIKWLEDDYLDSVDEMGEHLFRHTDGPENYTYVAEMQIYRTVNDTEETKYSNKMDHLVCFLPGTLALGYYHFSPSPQAIEYRLKYHLETPAENLNSRYDKHLQMSQDLARTCYHMYSKMGTGLSPEIANFVHAQSEPSGGETQDELQVQSSAAHNILRPEFVESLFYLYHITGLPIYREQASHVFEAFNKYSRIPSGYSPVSDVRQKPPEDANLDEWLHNSAPDRMESFWLSETLKYLYLVFCDDQHIVGTLLNNYVFNTEAHILPILTKV